MRKKTIAVLSLLMMTISSFSAVGINLRFEENYTFDQFQSTIVEEYDLVVISPEKFISELQPMIEHKNRVGLKTYLMTVESIYDTYIGQDEAEKIKFYIKDALENYNITYVLLVGDFNNIPMRRSNIQWTYLGINLLNHIYTDTYYADIYDENRSFSSWDSNSNGEYGEYTWIFDTPDEFSLEFIDSIDLYEDIGVGRLPCSNIKEVELLVDKIITYETTTYGSDWFNRLLLLGGDTFPNEVEIEGEFITSIIGDKMNRYDFESVKLWASLDTFSPFSINSEWSEGAGFVSFSGHGNIFQIATNDIDAGEKIKYYSFNLRSLKNNDRYPIVFLDACKTARFDISLFGIRIPCFAELLLKQDSGGAVAVIANYGDGYMTIRDNGEMILGASLLNILFFEAYEPGILLSDMITKAKNEYISLSWKDCLTLQGYNLLGDPSLKVGGYLME